MRTKAAGAKAGPVSSILVLVSGPCRAMSLLAAIVRASPWRV
ncbi:MAG: hypothetical protein WA917_14555 [Comamonas sp.]